MGPGVLTSALNMQRPSPVIRTSLNRSSVGTGPPLWISAPQPHVIRQVSPWGWAGRGRRQRYEGRFTHLVRASWNSGCGPSRRPAETLAHASGGAFARSATCTRDCNTAASTLKQNPSCDVGHRKPLRQCTSTPIHNSASEMAAFLASSFTGMTLGSKLTSTQGLTARAAPMRVARAAVVSPECMVRIRFQRYGRKKAPFYRIVAIDRKDRRDGRPLEFLGFYDPLKKETQLNAPAIKKWVENGAQPTETVRCLLKKALII